MDDFNTLVKEALYMILHSPQEFYLSLTQDQLDILANMGQGMIDWISTNEQ